MPALVAIGLQAFGASQLGFWLGSSFSDRLREWTERVAGIALIALGGILLVERLLAP